jgi:lipopolysaccharide export system protein LptA
MHSDHSKLLVQQQKDKIEALEEMEGITCFSPLSNQEEQKLKVLAKTGFYEYPSQNLVANFVECFHELGHLQAQKATLTKPENGKDSLLFLESGVHFKMEEGPQALSIQSNEAQCALSSQKFLSLNPKQDIEFMHEIKIQFAEGVLAFGGLAIYKKASLSLYPETSKSHCSLTQNDHILYAEKMHFDLAQENLHCEKIQTLFPLEEGAFLDITSDTLLWEKQKEKIALKTQVRMEQKTSFLILSDAADLFLKEENQLEMIEITENVRMFSNQIQNKESFAVADKIQFFPEDQRMTLTATSPKRVLFWQEGVSLSAPEIHIQKDPATKEPFVQGKGDVHFTFTLEEKNIIDQFISKYL